MSPIVTYSSFALRPVPWDHALWKFGFSWLWFLLGRSYLLYCTALRQRPQTAMMPSLVVDDFKSDQYVSISTFLAENHARLLYSTTHTQHTTNRQSQGARVINRRITWKTASPPSVYSRARRCNHMCCTPPPPPTPTQRTAHTKYTTVDVCTHLPGFRLFPQPESARGGT